MIFTSYGGLLPGQSKEDFFSCSSMPRNRELMRVFKDVGLVEQLGSGMSRILKEYDKSIFHISEHFIKVEFPFSLPKDNIIIANGNDNGNEIGDDNLYFFLESLVLKLILGIVCPLIAYSKFTLQTRYKIL